VTFAAYTGYEPLTFSDYIDMGTGHTLRAEPGQTYDIAPASGRMVPDIPEPWFTRAEDEAAAELSAESATTEPEDGQAAVEPVPEG
jgi:hypothetical protein